MKKLQEQGASPDGSATTRELDAEVAEKVMGYIWTPWRDGWHMADAYSVGDEWREPTVRDGMVLRDGRFGPTGPPGPFCSPVPPYSTSIADAWLVVEKMMADGYIATLKQDFRSTPYKWNAEFDGDTYGYSEGEPLPVSVCRAALKAVLTERGEVTP